MHSAYEGLADLWRVNGVRQSQSEIPNKLYFRIGEVSDILEVKPYVLRYWESEFPDIKPSKSKSGQRLYKRRDVELLMRIKELLYDERFTINGARKRLRETGKIEVRDDPQAEGAKEIALKQIEAFPDDECDETVELENSDSEAHPIESDEGIKEEFSPSHKAKGDGKHPKGDDRYVKTLQKIRKDLEMLLEVVKT